MRKTITKNCPECNIEFTTNLSDHIRGRGKFCSLSCAASSNNDNRIPIEKVCGSCQTIFFSKTKTAKYCSSNCNRSVNNKGKNYRSRTYLNAKIVKLFNGNPACFNCKWDLDVCDMHHIIPISKGGTDELNNITVLCPNCHRLAHKNKLTSITPISERIGLYHHP